MRQLCAFHRTACRERAMRVGGSAMVLLLGLTGTASARAGQYHPIYTFKRAPDGQSPVAGLVKDAQGRLYGTTQGGGAFGFGTVFRLTPPASGSGQWAEEILHSFSGPDGAVLYAPVLLGSDGSVYGITEEGGIPRGRTPGGGVVFKLANTPGWPLTILHEFGKDEGGYSQAGLSWGPDDLLYGTTSWLGLTAHYYDQGTAFSVSPLGDAVEYKVIHDFGKGTDGYGPVGLTTVPLQYFNGFAGVTTYGGSISNYGTFYSLEIEPGGLGTERVQYNFGPPPNLSLVFAPPILGQYSLRKQFFGCASSSGTHGKGGVYRVASNGDHGLSETDLYSFGDQANDPNGNSVPCYVVQGDQQGKIYGTTASGGANSAGAFFELNPPSTPNGAWTEKVDVSFVLKGKGGDSPQGAPLRNGAIYYGAMLTQNGNGAIYELTP